MDKRSRVYAALEGLPVDRVPISLWRHFYKQEQTATGLASATLAFYNRYKFDLIKLTPSTLYSIEDWGAQIVYSKTDEQPSFLKKSVIKKPADWRNLTTLRGTDGAYGQVLEAIKLVKNQLTDADAPMLMTVFTPLTIAYQLAGNRLFEHIKEYSTDVHIGLATIAETISRFANVAINAGADGIFFTNQVAQTNQLDQNAYQKFGVTYDLIALERVKTRPIPLVLHLEGERIYFETVNQYPVHAISWQSNDNNISVVEALQLTNKTLMTGLPQTMLEKAKPATIITQAKQIMEQVNQQRFILAPSDIISPHTPDENLQAISQLTDMAL